MGNVNVKQGNNFAYHKICINISCPHLLDQVLQLTEELVFQSNFFTRKLSRF